MYDRCVFSHQNIFEVENYKEKKTGGLEKMSPKSFLWKYEMTCLLSLSSI